MSGQYIFRVPFIYDKKYSQEKAYYVDSGSKFSHHAPYRKMGVQRVEWLALKLRKLLVKQKMNFKWHERKLKDCVKITVIF